MDNGDFRVGGVGRVVLELGRQEEGCLDILLKCVPVLRHVDVTDHGNGHPQVSTCTPSTHRHQCQEFSWVRSQDKHIIKFVNDIVMFVENFK